MTTTFAELLLRGAVIGINLLIALRFLLERHRHPALLPGALFALCVAIYAYLSSHAAQPWTPALLLLLIFLSTFSAGLFWLFALALFNDRLSWDAPKTGALAAGPLFFVASLIAPVQMRPVTGTAVQLVSLGLFIAVMVMALRDVKVDLVEPRRRFRAAVSIVIPSAGAAIVIAEIYQLSAPLPGWASPLQAAVLFTMSFAFAAWTMRVGEALSAPAAARVAGTGLRGGEKIELARLKGLIDAGALFAEGLSIGGLAAQLNVPEHRLRRLINQGLGYRNFSAFLNDFRIAKAETLLSDPDKARVQIIQIAFDTGYASLAPFNRAFREKTGMTPTQYREAKLSGADRN